MGGQDVSMSERECELCELGVAWAHNLMKYGQLHTQKTSDLPMLKRLYSSATYATMTRNLVCYTLMRPTGRCMRFFVSFRISSSYTNLRCYPTLPCSIFQYLLSRFVSRVPATYGTMQSTNRKTLGTGR